MTFDVHQLDLFLLVGSAVTILAILAVRISSRAGLPSLLIYLLMGVLLGESGFGIHFEDASVVQHEKAAGSTFNARVDVVEWLGNEAYAYIPFEAPPEVQEQLTQLEKDLDGESMRTQLVVSLDGASRIAEGDEAEIWVDASKIHLFDP